ncbi:MAG: hypothetical protein VZQ84_01240 [Anaerovoracaceae bacterium]|nr:hypothetical protein [Anaerovoracaceae bacterium]
MKAGDKQRSGRGKTAAFIFTATLALTLAVIVFICSYGTGIEDGEDQREAAHGMNFIRTGEDSGWLIWSDQYGRESSDGNWNHDIHAEKIDLGAPSVSASDFRTLVSAPEAQEPASASLTGDGEIFVTFEDGYDNGDSVLSQRYVLFDRDLNVIKRYEHSRDTGRGSTVMTGGHSGHVSSTSDRTVVFWCEGWKDGGGVGGLGSGENVGITVYNNEGDRVSQRWIANDSGRNWWPLTASSRTSTLLLWQKYVDGKDHACLMAAVYDPVNDRMIKKPANLDPALKLRYYTYSCVSLGDTGGFLVMATRTDGTAAVYLLDDDGSVKAVSRRMPGIIREGTPAVRYSGGSYTVVYPNTNGGATRLTVNGQKIKETESTAGKYMWNYRGTAGFFDTSENVWFAVLEEDGPRLVKAL